MQKTNLFDEELNKINQTKILIEEFSNLYLHKYTYWVNSDKEELVIIMGAPGREHIIKYGYLDVSPIGPYPEIIKIGNHNLKEQDCFLTPHKDEGFAYFDNLSGPYYFLHGMEVSEEQIILEKNKVNLKNTIKNL